MPKTATTPTRPTRRESRVETTQSRTVDCDDTHGWANAEKRWPLTPQEFYAEMTKRHDVREILKQLADG